MRGSEHVWSLLGGLSADGRLIKVDPAEVGRAAMERGSGMRTEDALIIVGGLITLLSLISLIGWLRQQRIEPTAGMVFRRVAREAGLTRSDRRLLGRIGHERGLTHPLTLMLCPGTLGRHARAYARARGRRRGSLDLARAASIRRHLFGPAEPAAA
jgi:hypothetical protein